LWFANKDDPRWQEIPRWQKDLFWIVMTKDNIYRIPKPFEMGVIFGSGPERALEAYFAENPKAFKDFSETMGEGFTPQFIPSFAAPIIDHFANKSAFTGAQIVPSYLEGILPEYQYSEYTSEFGKIIGKMVAAVPGMRDSSFASPMVIENYMRAWTGGAGKYAIQAADKALTAAGIAPDPVKPASSLADIPVIKAFVIRYPSASAQSLQDFYERNRSNQVILKTIQSLAQSGDFDNARKEMMLQENQDKLISLQGLQESLTNQTKFIRLISKNPDFTPDEKRQIIDGVYYRMIESAKYGNQLLDEVEKAVK
jgi:hypothetical protein